MKNQIASAKNFVVSHKTAILATTAAVLTVAVVAQRAGLKQHDEFLKENNLYDKFYELDENE